MTYLPDIPREDAACDKEGVDPEMFFDLKRRKEAARHCAGCPVVNLCFLHAVAHDSEGTWGGIWFTDKRRTRITDDIRRKFRVRSATRWLADFLGVSTEELRMAFGHGEEGLRNALRAESRTRGQLRSSDPVSVD